MITGRKIIFPYIILLMSIISNPFPIDRLYAQTKQKSVEDYCKNAEEYWKAKEYEKAVQTYKEAIKLFPNNQVPYAKLESIYLTLDKFDEADFIYREYLDKMGEAEIMRLIMLDTLRKPDLAIGDLLKIISFKPEYAPAVWHLGSIYKKQGKYLRAKIYLENAFSILSKQGDLERAKKIKEELESIYAKNPEVFQTELKTFSNIQEKISVMYPPDWYVKEENQGDIYCVFLSREKITKPGDIFKTGISVMKFYNADQFEFDMPPNKVRLFPDMRYTSMALHIDLFCTQLIMQKQLISRSAHRTRIGDIPACIAEISFKNNFGFSETVFFIVSYKDNTFVKFTLEAPIEEFEKFYPVFKKVIDSAKLF